MLTITSTSTPATDLGFLLHKHAGGVDADVLECAAEPLKLDRMPTRQKDRIKPHPGIADLSGRRADWVRWSASSSSLRCRWPDHRFEWTRAEFQAWANAVASRRGDAVRFEPMGDVDPEVCPPPQMAVFKR
jgi:hypothetical protein